jgi:hypothetical protein
MTLRELRALDWKELYRYASRNQTIVYYGSATPGIIVTHRRRGAGKVEITYLAAGRKTESPSQAVRWVNQAERKRLSAADI